MKVDEKPEPPTDEIVASSLSMLRAERMAGSMEEDGIVMESCAVSWMLEYVMGVEVVCSCFVEMEM